MDIIIIKTIRNANKLIYYVKLVISIMAIVKAAIKDMY